jgi:hypothetical protein
MFRRIGWNELFQCFNLSPDHLGLQLLHSTAVYSPQATTVYHSIVWKDLVFSHGTIGANLAVLPKGR